MSDACPPPPMTYADLSRQVQARQLEILGGFHPGPEDVELAGFATLVLLGPREPGFWAHVTREAEFADGQGDPLDRWSKRMVRELSQAIGGKPFFPSDGPPYMPFYPWALKTGRCHVSPINLLVHDEAGLFVSFRAALALPVHIALPETEPSPCPSCHEQPCLSACPVSAFASGTYDTGACRNVMRSSDPEHCLSRGCAIRRACPSGHGYGRLEAQSAYHMRIFLENGL